MVALFQLRRVRIFFSRGTGVLQYFRPMGAQMTYQIFGQKPALPLKPKIED